VKRIFLTIVVFFVAGLIVYAQQQSEYPSRQEMQNYLNQVKSNTSDHDSRLSGIISRNSTSGDAHTFLRMKSEIDALDARITREMDIITAVHDKDTKVSSVMVDNLQRMIDQRKEKQEELEKFLSN
jgi:hypothetical protein